MERHAPFWSRWKDLLLRELRDLVAVRRSDRPWEMPMAAALCSGLPIFIAAWYGNLALGLAATLGGQVFLYLPATRLSHRMAWLMACAFGMAGSYALGILTHVFPPLALPVLVLITIVVTMICRFYGVPPPGSLFFVMAAAIAAYTPAGDEALVRVGALTMGCLLAVAIAFVYSLYIVGRRGVPQPPPVHQPDFDYVVLDSVVIGGFVGLSLLIAHALQVERPYWVPVTCLAILQGVSIRAVWLRQLHRIAGTAVGLLVFVAIAKWPLNAWGVAAVLTMLTCVIETLVVRHYGLATVCITPLTIPLADAAHTPMLTDAQSVMQARLVDTVIGAVVGLVGGACLHLPRFRAAVRAGLRRVLPVNDA